MRPTENRFFTLFLQYLLKGEEAGAIETYIVDGIRAVPKLVFEELKTELKKKFPKYFDLFDIVANPFEFTLEGNVQTFSRQVKERPEKHTVVFTLYSKSYGTHRFEGTVYGNQMRAFVAAIEASKLMESYR